MYSRCNALYLAFVESNYAASMNEINRAQEEFPRDKKYALSIKFDIARLFGKTKEMEKVIQALEADGSSSNTIVICKSKLLADTGEIETAIDYFLKNITYFTEESKIAFCEKLKTHS